MKFFSMDCPFCGTKAVGFSAASYSTDPADYRFHHLLLRCGACSECVVARCQTEFIDHWLSGQMPDSTGRILKVHPAPIKPSLPEDLPPRVGRYYEQGMNALSRGDFDAAGGMFRKCLESALRSLKPEDLKSKLYDRIRNLPPEKGVTPSMQEWADKIRTLGNDAVHEDEEFSEEDATELQSFSELFLVYTFSLPAKVSAKRKPEDLL